MAKFVVLALSKKRIASLLGIKKTDKRLTKKFCIWFAKKYGKLCRQNLDFDDFVGCFISDTRYNLGVEPEEPAEEDDD